MTEVFYNIEIISFLKAKNFAHFIFRDGCAYIYSHEAGEIIIEATDHDISTEIADRLITVLEYLDEFIEDAYNRIRTLDLNSDEYFYGKKWFPQELEKVFEVFGIDIGNTGSENEPKKRFEKYCREDHHKKVAEGFSITFMTKYQTAGYYPLHFTVKFDYEELCSYAIEATVF
ncbi:MAG: hypothetical protein IKI45_07370 [Oscillospiraceae bacterium]|nr:hypothetical protein [Oscillospiraceae bacterium]